MKKIKLLLLLTLITFGQNYTEESANTDTSSIDNQKQTEETKKISSWNKIAELYLPSLPRKQEEQKETVEEQQKKLEANPNLLLEKMFSQIIERDKVELILNMLAKNAHIEFDPANKIVDDETYQDLTIFCGKQEEPSSNFINISNRTKTIAGRAINLDLLYNPTTDIEKLKIRQKGIKELVKNEVLYSQLKTKLEQLSEHETGIISLWNEHIISNVNVLTKYFYIKDLIPPVHTKIVKFNEKTSDYLNGSRIFTDFKRIYESLLATLINLFINAKINFSKEVSEKLEENRWLTTFPNRIEEFWLLPITLSGMFFIKDKKKKHKFIKIMIAPFLIMMAYGIYKSIYEKETTSSSMNKILKAVQNFINTSKEIEEIISQNEPLKNSLSTLSCKSKFDYENSNEFKYLLKIFKSNSFSKEPNFLSLKGKILSAFYILKKIRMEFFPAYEFVGKVDAIVGIANIYNEHKNLNSKYCFANYLESNTPQISLNEFWNPFIETEKAITNSLSLGKIDQKNTDRCCLLTGPNAGGKSTSLKAIALAALLSQSLTIAPAQEISLTPFKKIVTLLNITDACGQESLYQAHTKRAKFALDEIKKLQSNEFALIIPDELYNSTGEEYATALYYSTLKHIAQNYPNVIFSAATHFPYLSKLEKETNGIVKNYKMQEAAYDENGKLQWTYKILPGINSQNISIHIAKQYGQDEAVLQEAQKVVEQFQN